MIDPHRGGHANHTSFIAVCAKTSQPMKTTRIEMPPENIKLVIGSFVENASG